MNRTPLRSSAPLLLAGSLLLAGAGTAHAQVTINYSTGAYSFTAPTGDASFKLTTQSAALTLVQGVAQTVNIQSIFFTVNETNIQGDYTGNVSRTLTINSIAQNDVQGYDLSTDYGDGSSTFLANDDLTFSPGSPGQILTYDLGSKGIVTFTPEPIDVGSFFNEDSGTYASNVRGKFLLSAAAVPEASTTISLGLLLTLGGLGLLTARSRKRSAA